MDIAGARRNIECTLLDIQISREIEGFAVFVTVDSGSCCSRFEIHVLPFVLVSFPFFSIQVLLPIIIDFNHLENATYERGEIEKSGSQ